MRLPTSAIVLSLLGSSVLTVAEDQIPLKDKAAGWLDKAKSYIPTTVPSVPNPVDAAAAALAASKVEKINIRNWQRKLQPKVGGEEEWMVYVTGGNTTCHGRCEPIDKTWNQSVPILNALSAGAPAGSPPLRLGFLDCDKDHVLCTGWSAVIPSIYHFIFPAKPTDGSSAPPTELRVVPLNISSTTLGDITALPRASKSTYLEHQLYDGWLHPVDSFMAKTGLITPLGYVMWGFGTTPSWLIMIGISFFTRQMMSRRMLNRNRPDLYGGAPVAQQQRAPGPAVAAAPAPVSPAGGKGSAKKRR